MIVVIEKLIVQTKFPLKGKQKKAYREKMVDNAINTDFQSF